MKIKQQEFLWKDMVTGNHYLMNSVSGAQNQVESNGEAIKQFLNQLTGIGNYKDRCFQAENNNALMPQKINSLDQIKNQKLYTPKLNKFQGYTQFPVLRNKKSEQNVCKFLTKSITDQKQLNSQKSQDQQITNREFIKPDTIFLEKRLQKLQQRDIIQKNKEKKIQNQFNGNMTDSLNQQPNIFQQKIQGQENKSSYFDLLDQKDQKLFNTYQENLQDTNFQDSFVNSFKSQNPTVKIFEKPKQFTSSQNLNERYEREIKELKGFKIPNQNQTIRLPTKNRFNVKISNNSELHIQFDRFIDKQANAYLYEIKEKQKKKKLYIDPITGKTQV